MTGGGGLFAYYAFRRQLIIFLAVVILLYRSLSPNVEALWRPHLILVFAIAISCFLPAADVLTLLEVREFLGWFNLSEVLFDSRLLTPTCFYQTINLNGYCIILHTPLLS